MKETKSISKQRTALTLLVAIAMCFMIALACTGCSSSDTASSSSSSSSEEAASAESSSESEATYDLKIGNATEGTYIALTNGTGADITEIALKTSSDEDFGRNLITDGTFAQDQLARLGYTQDQTPCDIRLTTADATYTLHDVDLTAMTEATVELQDGIAYLTYTDAQGNEESTLADEQAVAQAEADAAAQAEAEAQAAAEAEAQAQAEADAAAQADSTSTSTDTSGSYSDYSDSSSGSGSYSDYSDSGSGSTSGSGSGSDSGSGSGSDSGSGASQSEDTCVEGGIALR
jgi:hypothetical protein